jgi:hypothetical protein
MDITRTVSDPVDVALTDDLATTPEINKRNYAIGVIHIPVDSSITELTFYCAAEKGGTYRALYNNAGDPVTLTVTDDAAYELPDAVFAAPFVKIVVDSDGSATFTWIS